MSFSYSYNIRNTILLFYFKNNMIFKIYIDDFARHKNLKYKFVYKNLEEKVYFVETLEKNEKIIIEYVKIQL